MPRGTRPFGTKRFVEIKGKQMAYIDEGSGAPIVFAHGNPTSSYLWRNIMPECQGLGRLIACDMLGMGDSAKLEHPGTASYTFAEQKEFLFALWEELHLNREVILVLHDWGSAIGFEWAKQHPDRVQGIAYMEAIVRPIHWDEFPEVARGIFQAFRSSAGEQLVLEDNVFIEKILRGNVLQELTEIEMTEYRRPFLKAGEDRRPLLTWPRQLPIEGVPLDVVATVKGYGQWLATSEVPKLYIHPEPGATDVGKAREFCLSWPNQREVTVSGLHYPQEDSPEEIGVAIANFVRTLRRL